MSREARREARAEARKEAKAEAKERANKRLSILHTVYEEHDRTLDTMIKETVGHERISCRRGCNHCCDQMVLMSLPEALEIVLQYPEVVRAVYGELVRHEQYSVALGVNERVVNIYDIRTRDERQAFLDRWFEAQHRCVFLDQETGDCRVYEARPLACRGHLVFDEDPSRCGLRGEAAKGATVRGLSTVEIARIASRFLEAESYALVDGVSVGPMPSVVLSAFRNRDRLLAIRARRVATPPQILDRT